MTTVDELRARLWTALADGEEHAATALLMAAGLDAETVLLDVIAPTQARIGAEWADNRLTVAQEHWMTAINDRVIAAISQPTTGEHRGRVTVACVDGEWHALPARLLAETLRLRGWRVDYLGAQVPPNHLIAHLHQRGPDALALSSSIPTRLPVAHATITACQATGVPVIAGGAAFGDDGRYARLLGADAWAPDARAAADRLADLGPVHERRQVQVLPHLLDQEYTMVARTLPQLVKQTLADLEDALPQVREYTDKQRQHAAEDIARLVDFLATSLYVDDDAIFAQHIDWTNRVLTARGIPATVLPPTLDSLAAQLTDFPRASRCLTNARTIA